MKPTPGRVRWLGRPTPTPWGSGRAGSVTSETSAVSDAPPPTTIGFLSVLYDPGGVLGGYLVTNAWGRPLEFRLTTAVQPNRVQQILYGPTLTEYLHADLIGRTLVEKTAAQPTLIVTDSLPALGLRSRVGIPVVALGPADGAFDVIELPPVRSSVPLLLS